MADTTESLEREATSGETSSNTVRTFLNTLKAPRLSELTRKRRIDTNPPPPKGKRRARGEGSNFLYWNNRSL